MIQMSIDPEEAPRPQPAKSVTQPQVRTVSSTARIAEEGFIFNFRFEFNEHPVPPGLSARELFWANCFGDGNLTPTDINDAEIVVREEFPKQLIRRALSFAHARGKFKEAYRYTDLPFSFRVESVQYGSLLLDVSILGLGPLMSFFYNKPELVMAFMEGDAIDAFAYSVPSDKPPVHRPQCSIYPNAALEKAFAALEEPGPAEKTTDPAEKPGWNGVARRALQIPFLLPVLLALAVLYVAASLINGERDRLKAREAAFDAREKELRTIADARVAKLEALTLDLVKQLRNGASEAKAVSAPKAASAPAP